MQCRHGDRRRRSKNLPAMGARRWNAPGLWSRRKSRSRIRARCCFRSRDTRSSTSCATTWRWPRARCEAPVGRPNVLVRYPDGIAGEFFYQKRAPASRPPWIEVVSLRFPSGRSAEEVVPRDAAALAWLANLACLELHPHPVRAEDLDHPDELRVDLDPVPGVTWPQIREVAHVVEATLRDFGLTGWPKTSGSRGVHVNVRIERRWSFDEVRRAAPGAGPRGRATRAGRSPPASGGRKERHGVFVDYNQNAKDRTVASAYSVRPTPDARVSAPVSWDELDTCDPGDFTLADHAGALRRDWRPARGNRRQPRIARPDPRALGSAGARWAGRRPLAAALPEAGR